MLWRSGLAVVRLKPDKCFGDCIYDNGIMIINTANWGHEDEHFKNYDLDLGYETIWFEEGNTEIYNTAVALRPGERRLIARFVKTNRMIYVEYSSGNVKRTSIDYDAYANIYKVSQKGKVEKDNMICEFNDKSNTTECYDNTRKYYSFDDQQIKFYEGSNVPVYTKNGVEYLNFPEELEIRKGECKYIGLTDKLLCYGDPV